MNKKKDEPVAEPNLRMEYTVRTPHSGFTGERFGVRIRDGVGSTMDAKAARACVAAGYEVTDAAGEPLE